MINLFNIKDIIIILTNNSKSNITDLSIQSCSNIITYKLNFTIPLSMPQLSCYLKPIFTSANIETYKPLISEFLYHSFLNNLNNKIMYKKITYMTGIGEYNFVPQSFTSQDFFSYVSHILNTNSNITHYATLIVLVMFMKQITSINLIFFNFSSVLGWNEDKKYTSIEKNNIISYSWFKNSRNYILNTTTWLYKYFYNLSANSLYFSILSKVFKNIKHLVIKPNLSYNLCNNESVFTRISYVVYIPNIKMLNSQVLNVVYASLTVLYVLLGWLLDYISYMWMFFNKNMRFQLILTWGFWGRHSFYALLYMLWLFTGVFSTNGIYFLILSNVTKVNMFNMLILILGFISSCICSDLWFFFWMAIQLEEEPLNLMDFFLNNILPRLQLSNFSNNYSVIFREIYNRLIYLAFNNVSFNGYASLRRSLLEWLGFLSMVFSTYGSWDLYVLHLYYRISPVYNFFIWLVPTFLAAYPLVYLETVRPRFSYYYYGLIYTSFWTSICFSSNSILLGYFNVDNSLAALYYFLPVNFIIGLLYSLPLYRLGTNSNRISLLTDLILFIILIFITLLSAGLLWNVIGSM